MRGSQPIDERPSQIVVTEGDSRARSGALSILHLYSGNLYGGIETLLATLARSRHLEPLLHMEFALCFPGRISDELRSAGAEVHDLGAVRFRHPWTILGARRQLARLLAVRHFDVVVTHACWPHAVFAPVVRHANRRLVFWQHDFVSGRHWIERIAARTPPDQIISNSRASAATLHRLFSGVSAEIVYCPVAPSVPLEDAVRDRIAIRRELDTPDDAVVLIQACRMEHWKGHTLLIQTLGMMDKRPEWMVWIVGGTQRRHESNYLASLKSQAEAEGVSDRVRFLGQRTDVTRLLSAADIHCQPNIGPEPFGIAFIEALHAGLPVITTRMGGAVEIVTEKCGVLVEPGDAISLTAVLDRLIADPSERAQLGRGGPPRAAELCDPDRVIHRLLALLTGLEIHDGIRSASRP